MGLKELTVEQLEQAKNMLLLFEFYGLNEEDIKELKNVGKMAQEIANLKKELNELREEKINTKKNENEMQGKNELTIQKAFEEFMTPQQEFKVYGD